MTWYPEESQPSQLSVVSQLNPKRSQPDDRQEAGMLGSTCSVQYVTGKVRSAHRVSKDKPTTNCVICGHITISFCELHDVKLKRSSRSIARQYGRRARVASDACCNFRHRPDWVQVHM
jgi:hypothetical protein